MPSIPITALLTNRTHRRMFSRIDEETLELNIDNSTLEKLLTCPRSFEFYSVLGRDSGHRDALNYGTAIHLALEYYFLTGDSTEIPTILDNHFAVSPCSDGSWRNLDHALESMRQYVALREQMQKWTPIEYKGKPAVEICFKLPLTVWTNKDNSVFPYPSSIIESNSDSIDHAKCKHVLVNYTGKIDLAIQSNSSDDPQDYDILDHKTTSIGGPTFWKQFYKSPQMRGYTWAATQLFGRTPRKTIIDCIVGRAPTLKGKGVQHESEHNSYEYSAESIAEWHTNVISHIDTMLDRLSRGYFPESNTHCINKFGPCDYFDVCTQCIDARQILLASGQFAERTWSPIA